MKIPWKMCHKCTTGCTRKENLNFILPVEKFNED